MSLTLPTRTRSEFRTKAKLLAGDAESTVSTLWSTNEANYALTAAYREIMGHLLHKRHPACRHLHLEDAAATNPVATLQFASEGMVDIEAIHLSNDGYDLSVYTQDDFSILKPRDWEFLTEYLWGDSATDSPEYYCLMTSGADMQIWVAAPPDTAGTNSMRIVLYAIAQWDEASDAAVPGMPQNFDQLLINKAAINMRVAKDLDIRDLQSITNPMEMRMLQTGWEPVPENDYQIPAAGKMVRRTGFSTVAGWIKRR